MKLDTFLDKHLNKTLRAEDELENGQRVPSGKLSASRMGDALQWQILRSLAVGRSPVDDYTLRKFARGKHVEDWLLSNIPGVIDTQQGVNYRGVVGFYDALVDTAEWDFKAGIIPVEVKSVTNAKFKRIAKTSATDRGHKLQAGVYALAKKAKYFAVIYVASDDYRIRVHIHSVEEIQEEVDGIIDRYTAQKLKREVPVFAPEETWQKNKKYNPYYEWAALTEEEIKNKVKEYGL